MLTLKPNCECCDKDLPPSTGEARICTFECTFCADCAETQFNNTCPNCGGNLVERPVRPEKHLANSPASTTRFTKKHNLPDVINWRRISDKVTLSGQPTEEQLVEIKDLGVTHIINLGPHHNKGALANEAGSVAALGMTYVYIPVEFEDPTDQNFNDFCTAIESLSHTKIHIHCIYNARVSAFIYRYAKTGKGIAVNKASALMDSIWRPGHDWAKFIDSENALGRPNLYAGDDY